MWGTSWLRALALTAVPVVIPIVQAAEPTPQPLPRLEIGMHTRVIQRIATDALGRWAVTASLDKTARVWEVTSGRRLRVLRPPQDVGNEGELNAVAMSPTGETVAVGGWTGWDWDQPAIYLFERESGRLSQRLGGLPNVILHLSYSPDGRWLAATLGNGELWVFDARRNYANASRDSECKEGCHSAHFSADGQRLLTSCFDGHLRVYPIAADGRLGTPLRTRPGGGERPFAPRFSPDGRRIAVGFHDSTVVQVLDAETFAEQARPSTAGVDNGNLFVVAWSADGQSLLAGGQWNVDEKRFARRWTVNDWTRFTDIPVAESTLMGFAPLPAGGWLFGAAGPAWGVLDDAGQMLRRQDAAIADLRGPERLRVSSDGRRVRFSLQAASQIGRGFDLTNRNLGGDDPGLAPPRTEASGLKISDWRDRTDPKLNGKPLQLDLLETSRSVAVAPDAQRFVLGTEWRLRLFDRQGIQIWERPTPGTTWAVNVTGDNRFLVAAYGDGTIRWHRMTDGAGVLALCVHRDGARWVAWTPEGFYAASGPDAEEWMGYHLNRGKDQEGEFVSVRQLREHFYQPALVSQRLDANGDALIAAAVNKLGDVRTLLAGAKAPPPLVELLSRPELTGEEEVTVTVRVTDQGGGVGKVTFYIDGQPQQGRQAGLAADGTEMRTFPLPPGRRVRIEVSATNGADTVESERRGLTAIVTGPLQDAALYIFAVGVQKYRDPKLNLGHSAADAQQVAKEIAERAQPLFKRGVFVASVLTDQQASLDEIERGFAQLKGRMRPQDTLVVFLAGHGEAPLGKGYTFLPWDFERGAAGPAGEGLDERRLRQWLAESPSQTLLLLDTCDAGAAVEMLEGAYERLSAVSRRVMIGASRQREYALEGYQGHGVFTAALLRVLRAKPGEGAEPDLRVTRLRAEVEEEVRRIHRERGSSYWQRISGYLGAANFPLVRR